MRPTTRTPVEEGDAGTLMRLIETLEDHDDVRRCTRTSRSTQSCSSGGRRGVTLAQEHLNRATLARQMLLEREAKAAPAEVVRRLCGMRAQEPRSPLPRAVDEDGGASSARTSTGPCTGADVVRGGPCARHLHLATTRTPYVAMRPALQPVLAQALRALGDRARGSS